jgi:hypothetical protein
MKYQLVLQWPASSIENYDTVIAIEDALIEKQGEFWGQTPNSEFQELGVCPAELSL